MVIKNIKQIEKFDAHSHVGIDARNPIPSDIGKYCENARQKNIKQALLIGVPLPRYWTENGIYTPVNWESNGMKLNMFSELVKPDGTYIRGKVLKNPFAESNERLEKQVKKMSNQDLRLHFIPHVHPLLDSQNHLESVLEKKPLAAKIKGSSWGIDPKDIPASFFNTIKKYDVPLLVHTDYSAGPKNGSHVVIGANDPLVWIDILEKYDVRASLAHGLRLCEESWERVRNAGNQFIVGFGPKLNTTGYRVKKRGGDYVSDLIEMADLTKLTYDIDFAWNGDYNDGLDWVLDEEIVGKIPDNKLSDFYKGNAERFYGLNGGTD